AIVLQAAEGSVPRVAGSLRVTGDQVTVHPADAALTVGGESVRDRLVLLDEQSEEGPTVLELGSLRAYLIRRGAGRLALRVKDIAAPALREFKGLDYFPIDRGWRVMGRLDPAPPAATITVPDIVGDVLAEA